MSGAVRTSPVAAAFAAAGLALGERFGMSIAVSPARAGDGPLLADVSAVPRWQVLGSGAADWLAERALPWPAPFSVRQSGTLEIVRNARRGCTLIGPGAAVAGAAEVPDVLLLEDEACEFALWQLPRPNTAFDTLCAVDLEHVADDALVPLSLAGVDCALRRMPANGWRVSTAPACGPYLFTVLERLVAAAGGRLAGFDEVPAIHPPPS